MVGFGYDSHRFGEGNKLIIGGIKIDSEFGVIAHSDGDVLIHSLVDALLGAAGLGDIGEHYPDNNIQYKNADSQIFLKEVVSLLEQKKFFIENIDATILLETPKISAYKPLIKQNIAMLCNISSEIVNIKAKSNEKMGFVGKSEGIVAYSICQINKKL